MNEWAWAISSVIIMLIQILDGINGETMNISVIVNSQPPTNYFRKRFEDFSDHLSAQLPIRGVQVKVFRTNHDDESAGDWILSPLMLRERHFFLTQQWVFVCEDDTRVDMKGLVNFLSFYKPSKMELFGRGLYDDEPTIIHHFEFHDGNTKEFKFPGRAFGYVMSQGLVRRLIDVWRTSPNRMDFRIDVDHEMAMKMKKSFGVTMSVKNDIFCFGEKNEGCVTWLLNDTRLPDCGNKLAADDVFFAVKTCEKFLDERVPFIQNTWANDTEGNVGFFAEVKDEEIPTIKLNIPNYNGGFCLKLLEILRWFDKNKKQTSWLVVADDDTLLRATLTLTPGDAATIGHKIVPRLQHFLGCCDPQEAVVIGERYGYRNVPGEGYDYITGGGGIVLSRAAVEKLLKNAVSCPSPDVPDDMTLGMWARDHGIPILHSPLFHQARPVDYCGFLINNRKSISFHKFWNIDPEITYQRWLLAPMRQREFLKNSVKDGMGITTESLERKKKRKRKKKNTRHTTRMVEEL